MEALREAGAEVLGAVSIFTYGMEKGKKRLAEAGVRKLCIRDRLYSDFGKALAGVSGWELYLLSSHTELERCLGRSAQKRRRLYNGTLRCELYIYRRDGGSRR